jgi:hypothetical protein
MQGFSEHKGMGSRAAVEEETSGPPRFVEEESAMFGNLPGRAGGYTWITAA